MRKIELTQGQVALVDDADFGRVSEHSWCVDKHSNTNYAMTRINGKTVRMHRFVLALFDADDHVDHINGNGLDNRRENLRACLVYQNASRQRGKGGTSRHKGVYWDRQRGRWAARIQVRGKSKFLGRFDREEDAAHAYNTAATRAWGEFALLNEVS